jgi:hypothetical protein
MDSLTHQHRDNFASDSHGNQNSQKSRALLRHKSSYSDTVYLLTQPYNLYEGVLYSPEHVYSFTASIYTNRNVRQTGMMTKPAQPMSNAR